MSPPLQGTVLVTGASSGIGQAIARQLAPEARALVLVARREDRLEALATELRQAHPQLDVVVRPCDLTDVAAIEALVTGLHADGLAIDVLVNNAGIGDVGLFEDRPWEKLHRMMQLNVVGFTRLVHLLLPGMLERGAGGILMLSSGFGLTWLPGFAAYAGTKHYVTAFAETLRAELRGTGVIVTQVSPGPVNTEFEENTDNPSDHSLPDWAQLTADQCARQALAAFRRDRALVVPGWSAWALISAGRLTPHVVYRLISLPAARWIRTQMSSLEERS